MSRINNPLFTTLRRSLPAALLAFAFVLGMNRFAAASILNFSYTGSVQTYTVPTTGVYGFTVAGGQGGNAAFSLTGGLGATLSGEYSLSAGTVLEIIVGGRGTTNISAGSGGGGGGSFIYIDGLSPFPLIIAGGGGGAARFGNNGQGGRASTSASSGEGNSAGAAGSIGFGGTGGTFWFNSGAGGAGWLGNGGNGFHLSSGGFSYSSFAGGSGTNAGGYGGGGGAGVWGGGGGGGYTGGGGGSGVIGSGGGAGSYYDPAFTNLNLADGANTGDGSVTIVAPDIAPVPEPSSLILLGLGSLSFAYAAQRRRQTTA